MKPVLTFVSFFLMVGLARASSAMTSVCDRTPQVRDNLVQQTNKNCAEIDEADLLQITAVRIPRGNINQLKAGDFEGLSRVDTLNLKRNHLSELPPGILAPLSSLRVLVLLGNNLRSLPDDFMVGNSKIEKIHIFQNAFTTLSSQVLQNLKALDKLNLLEFGRELDGETQSALWNAFPRENEHVTLIFT